MNGFYDIISYPFGMILGFLYQIFNNNYGVALVAFTILAKLVLLPSSISQQKSQAKTQRTRSKLDKIRKKHAGDQQKLNEEMQAFYAKEGYGSMTGGCLPLLIQMPIIIGLYGAIYKPLSYILKIPSDTINLFIKTATDLGFLEGTKNQRLFEIKALQNMAEIKKALPNVSADIYSKIDNFNFTIFGMPLGVSPNDEGVSKMLIIVPLVSFAFAMLTTVYSFIRQRKLNPEMAKNPAMGCTFIFMPFMSLWLAYTFPVGIGMYWALNSLISFIQMLVLNHTHSTEKVLAKIMVKETAVRVSKEESVKINTKLLNGEN
ncbi:MAG: YidC/Oxa1 family membrane protein insertase [Clostridia bacterium]|nr:YidC/Oxa1 family membrane protein insertase [Clostridia bacterium]